MHVYFENDLTARWKKQYKKTFYSKLFCTNVDLLSTTFISTTSIGNELFYVYTFGQFKNRFTFSRKRIVFNKYTIMSM